MSKRFITFTLAVFALLAVPFDSAAQTKLTVRTSGIQPESTSATVETDRVRDGLAGPVRRIRTEIVKLSPADGKLVEGKRSLLEVVAYDIKGNKTENQYFPLTGGTLTGKEVYKYDDKGNISEMTLMNEDGTLLSKEVYRYEYDFAGNWNKMTTSVAAVEGGKVIFEPTEVTYRSIMYYLDENMFKMVESGAAATVPSELAKTATANQPQDSEAGKQVTGKQRLASTLPTSTVATNKLNEANSAEVKNLPLSTGSMVPVVLLDTEPPASSAPKPMLKPVSGGVLNGRAISLPTPNYPENAKRMRISGAVSVDVVVSETGNVVSAVATNGPATLRDAATQAALRAKFSPTKLSGQPVKVSGVINYKFTLAP